MSPGPRRADLRLVSVALATWASAWFMVGGADPLVSLLVVAGVVVACAAVILGCRRVKLRGRLTNEQLRAGVIHALACCGIACAVLLSIVIAEPVRTPDVLNDAARDSRTVTLELVITGSARVHESTSFGQSGAGGADSAESHEFMVEARVVSAQLRNSTVSSGLAAPVLLFAPDPSRELVPGATVRVTTRVIATEPGDGSAYLVFVKKPAERIGNPGPWSAWANTLRAEFRERAAALAGDGADLLPGLSLGDESTVPASLDEAMTASGLSHLTAVSGANCVIVVAFIMLGGALMGLPRTARIVCALAALGLFVILVTPGASVQRAAVMAAIALLALGSSRRAQALPALSLAVTVLLILDPWMARSFGFALSALATLGLIVLSPALTERLARIMPLPLAAAIAVPVAAQLACQPVLVLLTPTVSIASIPANLLAAPAAPIVTIIGLIGCMVGVVFPMVADWLAAIAWVPASWIAATARFFAHWPVIATPSELVGFLAVSFVAIGLAVAIATAGQRIAQWSFVGAIVVVVALLGSSVGTRLGTQARLPPEWNLAACDVGQGDAVVVRSAGQVALVDVGPLPEPLSTCISQLGISRINLLVLSHYDLDHVGGIDAVLGKVDRVLAPEPHEPEEHRLLDRLREGGAEVQLVSAGMQGMLGDTPWRILWPPASTTLTGNDASAVVHFAGELRTIFLGDLGQEAQSRLRGSPEFAAATAGGVTAVKFAHHGSGDQDPALYEQLGARLAIVSVGSDNDYGHPAPAALEIIASTGMVAARTDESGLIVLRISAARIESWVSGAG